MGMISFRVQGEEEKFIREYASINYLNLSAFIRETIMEKIEEDLELDEERILTSLEKAKDEPTYSHNEV